jgi:RES domain-containing protein
VPVPLGPPDIARVHAATLDIVELTIGKLLRIGPARFPSLVYFSRATQYRFDAPDRSYGVMYAALEFKTCFAEVLLRDSLLTDPNPTLFESDLAQLVVATLGPVRRRLRLARLLGPMPNLGIDGQISTHHDYVVTQAWSKALHDHPASVDGLLFTSRMNSPALSVAIFERGSKGLRERNRIPVLSHPGFTAIASIPGLTVIPDSP